MMKIELQGVCTHHLKNLSLEIEHGSVVVMAGPSGSGKSSLAVDTLYAESLRTYMDALAGHQTLLSAGDSQLESAKGLLPSLCLDPPHAQSTQALFFGDLTGVSPWLRQAFALFGQNYCPHCQQALMVWTAQQAAQEMVQLCAEERTWIIAPLKFQSIPQALEQRDRLLAQGFVRAWLNETEIGLDEWSGALDLELVVDRLRLKEPQRLAESLKIAWTLGPLARVRTTQNVYNFSNIVYCVDHGLQKGDWRPQHWNARLAAGACPHCSQTNWSELPPCHFCAGTGLHPQALAVKLGGKNWAELMQMSFDELGQWTLQWLDGQRTASSRPLAEQWLKRIGILRDLGLDYLNLGRTSITLSTGERQRSRLAALLTQGISGICLILDELSAGLHPLDLERVLKSLTQWRAQGNTLILVDHHPLVFYFAQRILEFGPGAGRLGGEILYDGSPFELARQGKSPLGMILNRPWLWVKKSQHQFDHFLKFQVPLVNNLRMDQVEFPLGGLSVVCGVSGSGKSTLIMECLAQAVQFFLNNKSAELQNLYNCQSIQRLEVLGAEMSQGHRRSTIASFLGILDDWRSLFASLPEAMAKGLKVTHFSPNIKGGRCEVCKGLGTLSRDMGLLGVAEEECPECLGQRFQPPILGVYFKGKNIAELLRLSAADAQAFFRNHPALFRKISALCDVGLSYLELDRTTDTLSTGEFQRLRLAKCFQKNQNQHTLFLLDEPSRGLFDKDIAKLMQFLRTLCTQGHTVIFIDHHVAAIQSADWLLELGPGGGREGGQLQNSGPCAELLSSSGSILGQWLRFQDTLDRSLPMT